MNTRIALAAAVAATLATATTSLLAANPVDGARPMPAQLDTNGDGSISRDEAQRAPRLAAAFDRIDTNKDGQLTREEMHAARPQRGGGHRAHLDVDKDGQISRDEAKAAPRLADRFDAVDANKDGQLSRDELSAWHQANGPHTRSSQPVQPPVKP